MTNELDQMILYEYTEILLGNMDSFSGDVFSNGIELNQKIALKVVKYALTIFMECKDAVAAKKLMTKDFIKKMKLDKVIGYIKFPPELDKKKDFFYIVSLLYPNQLPYKQKEFSVNIYKKILNGEENKFPRGYFEGEEGRKRACYCFKYLLNNYFTFPDTRSMYEVMGGKEGCSAVNNYELKQAIVSYYDSAIELLHSTLGEHEKNDFWYIYHSVLRKFKSLKTTNDNPSIVPGYSSDVDYIKKIKTLEEKRKRLKDEKKKRSIRKNV